MTTLAQSQTRSAGRSFFDGIQALRARFEAHRAVVAERRRLARELDTYTDAELAELGFSRFDIPAVAAGTYRR